MGPNCCRFPSGATIWIGAPPEAGTPGLAGLYQVNVNVPPGVMPGNQVPVTISVGGKSSSSSIYMAVK